jgi:hypothetical protein
MTDKEKIEHPSWCDRSKCTAPEFRPEKLEQGEVCGEHVSKALLFPGYNEEMGLRAYLSQAVAPWGTGTYLRLRSGNGQLSWMTEVGQGGVGFELFELLAQPIGDGARAYPALYGERYGWVADATSSGADAAETLDVVAAESPFDVDPLPLDLEGRRPHLADVMRALSATASTGHGPEDYADEDQAADEESTRYQLTVNHKAAMYGSLQEVQAAVALIVTTSLAANPVSLAEEAQTMNLAFTGGAVQAALDERGEWSTLYGVATGHPSRITVNREA